MNASQLQEPSRGGYFVHPQEVWTAADCQRAYRNKNGTPYKGFINADSSPYPGYGQTRRYNGGCERNGEWYQGETKPLPVIPDGWEFHRISSWGVYIRPIAANPPRNLTK